MLESPAASGKRLKGCARNTIGLSMTQEPFDEALTDSIQKIQNRLQSTIRHLHNAIILSSVTAVLAGLIILFSGCSRSKPLSIVDEPSQSISADEIEYVRSIEAYLPILPDSLLNQYRHYNKKTFYATNQLKITFTKHLADSLNEILGPYWSIDTLSIDHSIENFGTAAHQSRTLYISSSYFFMYPGTEVLRSIITHEFGHIFYARLIPYHKSIVQNIWMTFEKSALFYLFREGEYSHNARFGGHPEDSPEELFASAYNLLTNRPEEFESRLQYVDEPHKKHIKTLMTLVHQTTSRSR